MPQDQNKAIKVGLCLGFKGALLLSMWGLTSPEVTKQQQKESSYRWPSGRFTPDCAPHSHPKQQISLNPRWGVHGTWSSNDTVSSLVTRAGRTPAPSCAHLNVPANAALAVLWGQPVAAQVAHRTPLLAYKPLVSSPVQNGTGLHIQTAERDRRERQATPDGQVAGVIGKGT